MAAFETIDRYQDAVMWAALDTGNPSDYDQDGERVVSSTATDLKVRWQFINKEALDPNGQTITIDVELGVNQDIVIGSIFWLGVSGDLPTPVTDVTDLYKCVTFEKVPDLRGRVYERMAGLVRYSNELPTTS